MTCSDMAILQNGAEGAQGTYTWQLISMKKTTVASLGRLYKACERPSHGCCQCEPKEYTRDGLPVGLDSP